MEPHQEQRHVERVLAAALRAFRRDGVRLTPAALAERLGADPADVLAALAELGAQGELVLCLDASGWAPRWPELLHQELVEALEAVQGLPAGERLRGLRQLALGLGWPPVEAAWGEGGELVAAGEVWVEREGGVALLLPSAELETDTAALAAALGPAARLAEQLEQIAQVRPDAPVRALVELLEGWGLRAEVCELPSGEVGVGLGCASIEGPVAALAWDAQAAGGLRAFDVAGAHVEGAQAVARWIARRWL